RVKTANLQVFGTHVAARTDMDRNIAFLFEADQILPLSVIEVCSDPVVHFHRDFGHVLAVDRIQQQPDDLDGDAFGRLHQCRPPAGGAVFVDAATEGGSNPLTSHLDQAEWTDPENLRPRPVAANRFAQRPLDTAAVPFLAHVNEVVDDDSSQVPQSNLSADF